MIHLRPNRKGRKQDLVGKVIGDIRVIRMVAHPYCECECVKHSHTFLRDATHLRAALSGKDNSKPRCKVCVQLEREQKQAYRMGWPLEPEGAE